LPALGFGWPNRLVARLKEFVLNANEQDLTNVGLRKKEARTLLSKKDSILRTWRDTGVLKAARGIGLESLRKIAEHSVKTGSAKIDTVVTTDIHRLIRLPDTLHGKTGWKKAEFPVSNIDGFDPFKNAIAFKEGTATVFVSQAPEFRLGDETFGPYKNQKAELPTAAAVLLVCRGRAEVVKQDV
jgi:DNA primase small subunit